MVGGNFVYSVCRLLPSKVHSIVLYTVPAFAASVYLSTSRLNTLPAAVYSGYAS